MDGREGKRSDMDDTDKVGSESADYSKARDVAMVLWSCGSPGCIWDDLPIVRSQRLPPNLVWAGCAPAANLIRCWATTYPSSLIVHRGDSWHSAVC